MNNCKELETFLVDYLDGILTENVRIGIEMHLAGCATCAAEIASYREIQSVYRGMPELEISEGVATSMLDESKKHKVDAKTRQAPSTKRPATGPGSRKLNMVLAAAASMLAVAILAWNGKRSGFDFDSLVQGGLAHGNLQEWGPAIEGLSKALELDATNERAPDVMLALARLHLQAKDSGGALEVLDSLQASFPVQSDRAEVFLLRGDIYRELGDFQLAQETYQEGLAEHPEAAEAVEQRKAPSYLDSLESLGYLGYF